MFTDVCAYVYRRLCVCLQTSVRIYLRPCANIREGLHVYTFACVLSYKSGYIIRDALVGHPGADGERGYCLNIFCAKRVR